MHRQRDKHDREFSYVLNIALMLCLETLDVGKDRLTWLTEYTCIYFLNSTYSFKKT